MIILLQKSNFVSSGTYAYAGLLMKVRRQPSLSDATREALPSSEAVTNVGSSALGSVFS